MEVEFAESGGHPHVLLHSKSTVGGGGLFVSVGGAVGVLSRTTHRLQPVKEWLRGQNWMTIEATRLSHTKDVGLFKQFYRGLIKASLGRPPKKRFPHSVRGSGPHSTRGQRTRTLRFLLVPGLLAPNPPAREL